MHTGPPRRIAAAVAVGSLVLLGAVALPSVPAAAAGVPGIPPIGLTKGVASVNGGTANPVNTDHVPVSEGDSVIFRVDATNQGTVADANDIDVSNLQLWDVLPAGILCAQVSAVSDSGACTDPGDVGQPSFSANATRSAIVWTGTSVAALPAGQTKTYNYTVVIPTGVSVSTDLINTAAVRSYTVPDGQGGTTTHYPAANIDTTIGAGLYDAPVASDNSDVYLRDVTVAKGVASAISEGGNLGAEASPGPATQATPGERVTYSVGAIVPAHSTVYNATFTDPLPSGVTLTSATAIYQPDAGSATLAALPAGVTFSAAPPVISWPASYDNTTGTDQRFSMNIVATLAVQAGNSNGVTRTNTGHFNSQTAATGGTNLPDRTASALVSIVEPGPSLTKTNNSGGQVSGGQPVTYTLKPANVAGRPPLHDAWLLDCLPSGLTFGSYGSLPGGVTAVAPVGGNGSNGCPASYTVLSWNLGDLAGGFTLTLTYTATVDATASGKASLTNVAAVSGNSLAQARTSPIDPGNPAGRQYSAGANSTLTVLGATASKSVSPTSATVGDTVTYAASAVLPIGVNFYDLSLIDQLPNGIDPNSVVEGTVTCTNSDTTSCSLTSATPLSPVAGSSSSTIIGWLIGDVAASAAQPRTVTVHYTAKVKDVAAATAGAALTSSMHVAWNTSTGAPPTSAGATFDQTSSTVTATVTVLEPNLSIDKSVSKTHPEPGQSFAYTATVTNANTATASSAYNVTVTDTVPTGVVVDPASISGGGSISGANASTGGGTISWTLPGSITEGTSAAVLTYSAALAPSATLSAASLVNTARVTGYDSLPAGGRHYTGPSTTASVAPFFPKITTTKTTPGGSTAYIDESFGWRITARNTGGGAGYQVGTTDTLPANWTYDTGSAQVSVNGGTASQVDPAVASAGGTQTLTWTALGNLPTGAALTITFTATPQPGVTGTPGVGTAVNHTNSATSIAQDLTGATSNASGGYSAGPGTAAAHIASADVSIAKVVGTAPVAGQTGTWLLTVHNSGPNPATGPFTVTEPFNDPAPSGITAVAATGTGWSCTSTAPISCVRTAAGDTLASGASFPIITVTDNVDQTAAAGTNLTNTVTVTARTYDPNPANNSATANATVTAAADLTISKTLSSPQLIAGAPASYSLAVQSLGPSAAAGPITVHDALPAGTGFVSASGAGWSCDPITAGTVGATVHCTLPGPLAVGAAPPAITVRVGIPSGQTGAVSNTATVSSPTTDPVPANNSSTVSSVPTVRADLQIQKRHVTSPFVAGQSADYEIDVFNAGESDAVNLIVHDTLPAGLSYHGVTSTDPWSCAAAGAAVTCQLPGSFAAGTTTSFTLTVDLASDFDGPAVNTATVSSDTTDPVPGNNSSTDDSAISTVADLSIVKTDSGTTQAGSALRYQLAAHNAGPSDVAGPVTVSDSLPAGLNYDSATGTGWTCGYDSGTRLVTCTLATGLTTGADAPAITLTTTVDSAAGPATIDNTADVSSGTTDPDLNNNSSTDPVIITALADLSLTKVLSSTPPVLAGTDATFVLTANNSGPSDAVNVTVTDILPAGLSFDSYTGAGWACVPSGQDVLCTRASIAAGTSAPDITLQALVSASIPVTVPAGTTTVVNNATISSPTPGSDTNPDPVDVPVQAQADLSLVNTPKGDAVEAGSQFRWNLAVHNDGPSDAAAPIVVTDTLPAFETFISATPGWTCTAAGQTLTCTLEQRLTVGSAAPALAVLVSVDSAAPAGPVTNTASVDAPSTPGADGSDSATVNVAAIGQLTLSKVHTGHGVIGQDLTFTMRVHNNGPTVADQIVLSDPLPVGLSYVSAAGTGWTCIADPDRVVTCTLAGTIAVGADSADVLLTAEVGVSAYPGVTNVAEVSSADPRLPATGTASDPVVVDPAASLRLVNKHAGNLAVGRPAIYQLTISNSGPTETPGPLRITDTLPSGLSYRSVSGAGWTCSAVGPAVTCHHPGALAADTSAPLAVGVVVRAPAYPSVLNTATVFGSGSPPASGSDTAPVTPQIDLGIRMSLVSYRNSVATYLIKVTNSGSNATVGPILVTDPLRTGLSYRAAGGPGWSCAASGKLVTCIRTASLAAGASTSLNLVAVVNAVPGTVIGNVATVSGGSSSRSTNRVESSQSAVLVVAAIAGSGPTGPNPGGLAETGRNIEEPAVPALFLMLAGLGLVLAGRRRRRS